MLVSALRAYYGDYSFVTGVGMDGVIETLMRTLVDPGEAVAISAPTFSFYGLAAQAQGAKVVPVPRRTDFSVDTDALVRAGKDAKIVVLCTPNNPTGNVTPVDEVQRVLDGISGVLFLDNVVRRILGHRLPAPDEEIRESRDRPDVLEGALPCRHQDRVRFCTRVAPAVLLPGRTPFTVNSVSAAAAAAALQDKEHAARYIAQVQVWRKRFAAELKFPVLPSDANFVMVDVAPHTGDDIVEKLASRGVLVRSCRSFTGLADHYIRVSVGEDWENELFIRELNAL